MYLAQMEQFKRQHIAANSKNSKINDDLLTNGKNQVLSDANRKPRFQDNPFLKSVSKQTPIQKYQSDTENIISDELDDDKLKSDNTHDLFDSEIKDSVKPSSKNVKFSSSKKPTTKQELDEIFESLDETSIDISESDKPKRKNSTSKSNTSIKKPISSVRKPNNSVTKSVGRKRNNSQSETSKRNQILRI